MMPSDRFGTDSVHHGKLFRDNQFNGRFDDGGDLPGKHSILDVKNFDRRKET